MKYILNLVLSFVILIIIMRHWNSQAVVKVCSDLNFHDHGVKSGNRSCSKLNPFTNNKSACVDFLDNKSSPVQTLTCHCHSS